MAKKLMKACLTPRNTPKGWKTKSQTDTCPQTVTAARPTRSKSGNRPHLHQCTSWMNKLCFVLTAERYRPWKAMPQHA